MISLVDVENEVNNVLVGILDFLLEVAYFPPVLEAFGGREMARRLLHETVVKTDLTKKINSIYTVESALNALTTRFASLWIREGFKKSEEFRTMQHVLSDGGLLYSPNK